MKSVFILLGATLWGACGGRAEDGRGSELGSADPTANSNGEDGSPEGQAKGEAESANGANGARSTGNGSAGGASNGSAGSAGNGSAGLQLAPPIMQTVPEPSREAGTPPNPSTCSNWSIDSSVRAVQPGGGELGGEGGVLAGVCWCTRHDLPPTGECRTGSGDSVEAMIGPNGGTLFLAHTERTASVGVTLTIPPRALATETRIRLAERIEAPPKTMVDWSPVYSIEPFGLHLAQPASLRLPFTNGNGVSISDSHLSVFVADASSCTMETLPGTYVNAGFIDANVNTLGDLVVGYTDPGDTPKCR